MRIEKGLTTCSQKGMEHENLTCFTVNRVTVIFSKLPETFHVEFAILLKVSVTYVSYGKLLGNLPDSHCSVSVVQEHVLCAFRTSLSF